MYLACYGWTQSGLRHGKVLSRTYIKLIQNISKITSSENLPNKFPLRKSSFILLFLLTIEQEYLLERKGGK